jgi:hypothetical protein
LKVARFCGPTIQENGFCRLVQAQFIASQTALAIKKRQKQQRQQKMGFARTPQTV